MISFYLMLLKFYYGRQFKSMDFSHMKLKKKRKYIEYRERSGTVV